MLKAVFPSEKRTVTLYFEGSPVAAAEGMTVTAALMQAGVVSTRTTAIKHEERAPLCQMGVCFECLINIDGVPNQQGCLTLVREGMQVKRQIGAPSFTPKGQE